MVFHVTAERFATGVPGWLEIYAGGAMPASTWMRELGYAFPKRSTTGHLAVFRVARRRL